MKLEVASPFHTPDQLPPAVCGERGKIGHMVAAPDRPLRRKPLQERPWVHIAEHFHECRSADGPTVEAGIAMHADIEPRLQAMHNVGEGFLKGLITEVPVGNDDVVYDGDADYGDYGDDDYAYHLCYVGHCEDGGDAAGICQTGNEGYNRWKMS